MLSIIIAVYKTDDLISNLLNSILEQSLFKEACSFCFEIIIVNDASPNGKLLKKIIKPYKKTLKKIKGKISLVEHSKNRGTLEARRTGLNYAKGDYILFADPDDLLPNISLEKLYKTALITNAQIINGKMSYFFPKNKIPDEEKLQSIKTKLEKNHLGYLKNNEIFYNFLIESGHSSFLCGKLFKTQLVRDAYAKIPYSYCVLAEDFLAYFFIALKAKSYYSIEDKVYTYFLNYGITSNSKIEDLAQWEKVCSVSSVFTILFSYLEENNLGEIHNSVVEAVKYRAQFYYTRNKEQLESRVVPHLQEEAKQIMQDWWGIENG